MSSPFYATAKNFDDTLDFSGKSKTYRMAYDGGFPTITVESYYNQGVEVYYHPTGEAHCWSWKNRGFAWDWAKERKQHISYALAGGKYSNRA
jgi:hypothetical protein